MANVTTCVGNLTDIAAFNELKKRLGVSDTAIKAIAKVFDGKTFTSEFIKEFKEKHNEEPTLDTDPSKLADAIIEFNNMSRSNVSSTSTNTNNGSTKVSRYGYSNFDDRRKGVIHMATSMLKIHRRRKEANTTVIGNPVDYYWHQMKENHTTHCLHLYADLSGKDYDTVRKEFDALEDHPARFSYLNKVLGQENIAALYTNSFALWRELNDDIEAQKELRGEIFEIPILTPVLNEQKSEEEKVEEQEAEANSQLNDIVDGADKLATTVEKDDYIGKVTNEGGMYSSYMKHTSERIRMYFDTLDKTVSPNKENGKYATVKDEAYGLAETLGAEQAVDMLFSVNDAFTDPESMVDYIKLISQTVPGFECFAKLAEDCLDDYDFAAEIFRTFKKCVMDRIQVMHENGSSSVKLSTQRANKRNAMFFDLMNDAKSEIDHSDSEYTIKRLNDVRSKLNGVERKAIKLNNRSLHPDVIKRTKDEINAELPAIITELTTIIRFTFPSIEPKSVEAFITLANNAVTNEAQKLKNINALLGVLERIVDASNGSYKAWLSRQSKINQLRAQNAQLRKSMQDGTWDGTGELIDLRSIFASDYLTSKHKEAIASLRDLLLPYSVVATQKDVPNVKGNHFSVVINNSYITELKEILASSTVELVERNGQQVQQVRNKVLEDWGIEQAKDKRHRHSSILFEQTDDNGVITPGIFRIVTKKNAQGQEVDEVRLTEEGPALLEIYMLDGATDMDSGSNMTYDEMVFGDFCPTAFIQFFGTEQNDKLATRIASYFPRIPSDATTLYSIRAPRYDVSDIWEDVDPDYRRQVTEEIISNITLLDPQTVLEQNIPGQDINEKLNNVENVETSDIHRIIKTKYIRTYERNPKLVKLPNGQGLINYSDGNYIYTFLGTLQQEGNEYVMRDAQVMTIAGQGVDTSKETFKDAAPDLYNSLYTVFSSLLDKDISYYGKDYDKAIRRINREANAFKILRNQFRQEMMGAALAVDHYFDTDEDGFVIDKDPDSDVKVIKLKDGRDNKTGYKFYHLGKSDRVLDEKDGHYSLGGAAFHSDKFTLSIDVDGTLVPVNFLDEIIGEGKPIDILYGGANEDTFLHVKKRPIFDADGKIVGQEVVDVYFTEYQQQAIDNALEEWLTRFLDKAKENIEANEQFIKGVSVDEQHINEFAINNAIFLMNCDDLFDGDTGFYKNSQTVLKRAKQYEGSGMLYSLIDRNKDTTEPNMSYLNDGEFNDYQRDENGKLVKDENGKLIPIKRSVREVIDASIKDENGKELNPLIGTRARKTFRAVTVHNTTLTNRAALDPIVEELIKTLPGDNKDEKRALAEDIVYGKILFDKNGNPVPSEDDPNKPKRKGGFTDVTVNDAQSYITFEEWVRRIAGRGQLKRYLPLIKKLIDPNSVLTAADLQEFVQVQKNFYFDKYYDERYGIFVPRQIKNAEFVLVPRLIKGTQLEKVYELMKEAGIDQLNTVETSKAANEEIVTLWDSKGELTGADTFVENAKRCGQEYSYRYLYTQQETPQHMDATNKVGIQISKKIIDNIPEGHPLYDKKIEYMNLLVQNIRDSYESLLRTFGVKTDDKGNILYNEDGSIDGLDLTQLYEKLKQEMRRQGVDENLIDYVTLEDGQPRMPALVNSVLTKFESVYQSVFNNAITKQKLPGFHAAQVTNVGWKSYRDLTKSGEIFNTKALDMSKVDIEIYDREKTPGYKNKALKIYIKGKTKGYFELVKDKEDDYYSVHFKTLTENGHGSEVVDGINIFPSTKEERDMLFEQLRRAIPEGAKVSTWGSLSPGGFKGLDKLANGWKKVGTRTVKEKGTGTERTIPVYEKPTRVSYDKKLRYRPVVDGKLTDYIEVMLPASMFGIDKNSEHYRNMTDKQIIEELEAEGLDIIMGYRIPTEGKQSVCNMKIVGFTDDAYGSTIIVPDEWVAQTGSDFDIDSVYGIKYETYKDKTGKIHKVQYLDDSSKVDIFDYYKYINETKRSRLGEQVDSDILDVRDDISERLNQRSEDRNFVYQGFMRAENDAFSAVREMPKHAKLIESIIKNDRAITKKYNYAKSTDIFLERLKFRITKLENYIKKHESNPKLEEVLKPVRELLEASRNLQTFLLSNNLDAFKHDKNKIVEEELLKRQETLEAEARSLGLMSFAEFKAAADDEVGRISINSRKARNNRILENMKEILGAASSLEENVSRSNFDDIIYWRDQLINKDNKTERDNRSPYDPFDQMRYQEDAISGTHLKGISVSLDTWCSVCNTVRPTLTQPIKIVYDAADIVDKSKWTHQDLKDNQVLVTHDKYGWSDDNEHGDRNIVGRLLTVYSSETTAHILDAVKEGAVPGVNVFTFPAYKTLLNIGSDYKTAISFIMQPGVKRIIDAYNSNNSVFNTDINNPVQQAIESIAIELGIKVKPGTQLVKVLSDISEKVLVNGKTGKEIFNDIFRQTAQEELSVSIQGENKIPLLVSKMVQRLQNEGFKTEEEKLMFDLGVILAFDNLNKIAGEIQSIARLCNPDKFGAKQSIYATKKVFDDIHKQLWNYKRDGDVASRTPRKGILAMGQHTKDAIAPHILTAIYPGCDSTDASLDNTTIGILRGDVSKSKYRTLAAYLKYSSALSTILCEHIFPTQHPNFVYAVRNFAAVINKMAEGLDEATYNDVQKYILSHFYYTCPSICEPVTYDIHDAHHIKLVPAETDSAIDEANRREEERIRIFGFGHFSSIATAEITQYEDKDGNTKYKVEADEFTCANFHNPTEREIDQFRRLSPAQKVQWLKRTLDDPEIFGLYQINLDNGRERGYRAGMQTIEYIENNLDKNTVFKMFKDAFYNSNPLIKLAAIDLIKYSVMVEGLTMGSRSISKTIPNVVLRGEFGDASMGLIDHVVDKMHDIGKFGNPLSYDTELMQIYEDYLRSHPETKGVRRLYLSKKNKTKFKIETGGIGSYGMIYIPFEYDKKDGIDLQTKDEFNERMAKAGILKKIERVGEVGYEPNKYIRIVQGKKNTLYKINQVRDGYILYPLTPLEKHEHGTWSAKQSNNEGHPSKRVYDIFVANYNNSDNTVQYGPEFVKGEVEQLKADRTWQRSWYRTRDIRTVDAEARNLDLQQELNLPKQSQRGEIIKLVDQLVTFWSNPNNGTQFIWAPVLDSYITAYGAQFASLQTIKLNNGSKKSLVIAKLPKEQAKDLERLFLRKDSNRNYVLPDSEFETLLKQIPNAQLRRALQQARAVGHKTLDSVYQVTSYIDSTPMYASVEEVSSAGLNFVEVDMNQGSKLAIETIVRLQQQGIKNDKESLRNDSISANRELAAYAIKKGQELITRFNYFLGNQSMLADEVLESLKGNEGEVDRYLTLLNEIKAFLNLFSGYIAFDTTSEDTELKFFIDKIKDAVIPVTKLDIDSAAHKFAEVYCKSMSSNPLLVDNIINIFDGYWKSAGAMWRFHDVMENGNPLLQIIGKDIMGNLEAKRIANERFIRNFHKEIARIKAEASAAGQTIDFDKFIDADGRFIQDYKNEFVDKINELRANVSQAATEFGIGSVEHLHAKNAFDIFKATFINQEADPQYYIKKAELEYEMLRDMPEFYSVYMTALMKRNELLRAFRETGLSEEQEKELSIQENVIHILTGNTFRIDESISEGRSSEEERRLANEIVRQLQSTISAQANAYNITPSEVWMHMSEALSGFIEDIRNLNDEYFEYESVFGFEELLETHLRTIADFEQRVNGVPTIPASVLENNEKYREAKRWIRENARFELNAKFGQHREPMNVGAKIVQALNYLGRNSNGRSKAVREYISEIEKERGIQIIDEYGNIDGSKFTDDEIERINIMLNKTRITVRPLSPFAPSPVGSYIHGASDRQLIRSVPGSTVMYSKAFYDGISRRARRGPITPEEAEEIRLNGDPDERYRRAVKRINEIYLMWFDGQPLYVQNEQGNGVVHLERIPMTQEGVELLRELANLYTELKNIERGTELSEEQEEARQAFMDENVEIDTSTSHSIISAQKLAIDSALAPSQAIKDAWIEAWKYVTFDRKRDGSFIFDQNGELVPNSALYGVLKPKSEVEDRWIDHKYTEALQILTRYYRRVPSKYYMQAAHEAEQRNQREPGYYKEWYEKNHIFNPETGKVEPLDIWMDSVLDYEKVREDDQIANSGVEGYETKMKWVARPSQSRRKVKDGDHNGRYIRSDDRRNPAYDPDGTLSDNYAGYNFAEDRPDTEWRSNVELNPYEKEMRDYLRNTLIDSTDRDREKYRFKQGWLPAQAKEQGNVAKRVAKEAGKMVGLVLDKKKDTKDRNTEIGFEYDRIPPLPMSDRLLWSAEQGSKVFDDQEPKLEDFSDQPNPQQAYNEAHARWEQAKQENEENNRRVHQALLDRDWETVIANYLAKQGTRRALQEEKQKMYYVLNMLKQQRVYSREHDLYGDLKQDDKGYMTSVDQDLIEQWKTFTRRMLNDEYKDSDSGLTRMGNRLQQFTSANYMMMNIKGGISNVTLGLTGMIAEAAASEFVDRKSLGFGIKQWNLGVVGMFRGIYDDYSYNKQDAIVKLFKVVDYDEISGISTETDLEKYSERLRNAMFSPQTIGEHYMQNSVLFAMLRSHKIVELDEPIKGLNCTFMNEGEYIRYNSAKILNEILTDEQREELAKFKRKITSNAQELADYAWWKKDVIAQFVAEHLTREQREEYIKKRDQKEKELKDEFASKEDMWSQIELGDDGYAAFVPGSKLAELSVQPALDGKVNAADLLIGQFSERVRKVNNKIHGVYNKKGRAYIENKWYGGLVMQYHKHLPTGILKRYRNRGYYNETRGTVEKGMIQSIVSLSRLNIQTLKTDNKWTDDEAGAVESLINLLTHSFTYLTQLKHTWKLLPEYDRANVRRNLGDLTGVLSGVAGVIALLSFGDDDNDDIWYNLMLYECDRLASEAFLYNPIGLWTETKTLMSTPIAGESIIDDCISAIENIALALVGDDEYDGLYHTGQFAGRNKIRVYVERRLPVWNGIRSIRDLPNNNRYFKRGEKVTKIIPTKAIAKRIKGED